MATGSEHVELSRRRLLQAGLGAAAAAVAGPALVTRAAQTRPAPGGLSAIEHVVFVVQENRSFDHYFGTLRGVRGFDDRRGAPLAQPWPGGSGHTPAGVLLPFRLDSSQPAGAWVNDITHDWGPQHECWHRGRLDRWATVHPAVDGAAAGTATMGYYTREDLPFLYALADAFTVCDAYHCSAMAPTYPNRLYSWSATIDPEGVAGGPAIDNTGTTGQYSWTTMPERLEKAGVSWKLYQPAETGRSAVGNDVLWLFKQYQDQNSSLYQHAFTPTFPGDFEADAAAGALPQVSWVLTPPGFDEHPPSPSGYGAFMLSEIVRALTSNADAWSRTVLFVTYDENGGFFDHVAPPVAPAGTKGEYLSTARMPPGAAGVRGPIGLGFRVPMLVVSPFSRGGWVCGETFDHTSMLRFLETRFGVEVPNLSAWRRGVTGDLTGSLDLAHPDVSVPALPQTATGFAADTALGAGILADVLLGSPTPPYPVPPEQSVPAQEPGRRPRRKRRASTPGVSPGEHGG